MAGGLKGGYDLLQGKISQGEKHESTSKVPNKLAGLYASGEVLSRRINFQPAKSADAHSLTSSKLKPLNCPPQLTTSSFEAAVLPANMQHGPFKRAEAPSVALGSEAGKRVARQPKPAADGMDIMLTWKGVRGVGAGLSNMGNTCFLNSVLQCLTYTPPLVDFLETGRHHVSCQHGGFCALCELRKHVLKALASPHGVVGPTALVRGLRNISRSFRIGRQEDAHEYMRHLVEALHKACLPPDVARNPAAAAKASSFVQRCFGGKLRSQVQCTVCSFCSNTCDPFLDLSLEIHRADSLLRALQRFTAPEVLDGDNKYRCSRCKKKVRALKRFSVEQAPPVLTVQLKRFSAVTGGKIDKFVQYSSSLDLRPFLSREEGEGPLQYSLYAVLVHAGWSTHSGHYYCFVRTAAGIWHAMDDSRVRQVSEKTVLEQKAYILFYIQKPEPKLQAALLAKAVPARPSRAAEVPKAAPAASAPEERMAKRDVVPGQEAALKGGLETAPTEVQAQKGRTAAGGQGGAGGRELGAEGAKQATGRANLEERGAPKQQKMWGNPEDRVGAGKGGKEGEVQPEDGSTQAGSRRDKGSEQGDAQQQASSTGGEEESGSSGRGTAGGGEGAWDEYYRQKAGKVWPRTPRSLMHMLLAMPKTRRYFWALGCRGARALKRVRRTLRGSALLRALGGGAQDLPKLAGGVLPGRRVTRGLAAQMLGEREGAMGKQAEADTIQGTPRKRSRRAVPGPRGGGRRATPRPGRKHTGRRRREGMRGSRGVPGRRGGRGRG